MKRGSKLSEKNAAPGFPASWPGMQIIIRLVEISCGLFILASTACRHIRDGKQLAMRRIRVLVNGHRSGAEPEKQLDQIYMTVLKESMQSGYTDEEKAEVCERFTETLGSIVIRVSPLSRSSLANCYIAIRKLSMIHWRIYTPFLTPLARKTVQLASTIRHSATFFLTEADARILIFE